MHASCKLVSYLCLQSEEFRNLSKKDRELWLSKQFSLFEQEVRNFVNEKGILVEQLYERLKKVTRRWASWNHKNFGPVISREQVRNLRLWEQQNQPKLEQEKNETDALEKFENYCRKSSTLLKSFRQDIYKPLCEFFPDENATFGIKENFKILEKCLARWETLLQKCDFSEKILTKQSLKFLNIYLPMRKTENDLILRLIPDLIESKSEALKIAHRSLSGNVSNFDRSGTYVLTSFLPSEKNAYLESRHQSSYQFNQDFLDLRSKLEQVTEELDLTKQRCLMLESKVESWKCTCEKLEDQLKNALNIQKPSETRFLNTKLGSVSTNIANIENQPKQPNACEKELAHLKIRYSSQKIRYMNARKQIETLNKQLDISSSRILNMEKNLQNHKEESFEVKRTFADEIFSNHSSVVEDLQQQCSLLKMELDKSILNNKKTCCEVNASNQRLQKTLKELKIAQQQCQKLRKEAVLRVNQNEELEIANSMLRELLKAQIDGNDQNEGAKKMTAEHAQSSRTSEFVKNNQKESMFPDIKKLKKSIL